MNSQYAAQPLISQDVDHMWQALCNHVLDWGHTVAPRGQKIIECNHVSGAFDMIFPVLSNSERKLSYKGMAAEALWITSGSDRLEDIAPWLPRMSEFSDDGATLWGAYGPRFMDQLEGVVDALIADEDTRQACMSFWRANPRDRVGGPSKDIPCTMSMSFRIRRVGGLPRLHLSVFMRSSDLFLGLPYDMFTFTMIASKVMAHYNERVFRPVKVSDVQDRDPLFLGPLYYTAASCHIYERDADKIKSSLRGDDFSRPTAAMPTLYGREDWDRIVASLVGVREGRSEADMAKAGLWDPRPY